MNPLPSPQDETQVLQERARLLARPRADVPVIAGFDVLEFTAAGQDCALELRWLREVRPLRGIALLPHAADGVLGIVHLRGCMLPLVELARVLDRPAQGLPDAGKLVVVGENAAAFAFVADAVQGLGRTAAGDVERASTQLTALQPQAVRGTTRSGRLLLDGAWLLHHFEKSTTP